MERTRDLIIERTGCIATVTFNRPAVKNALTVAMCRDLRAFFESLHGEPSVRVVCLRGAGADFCSGADLNDVGTMLAPEAPARSAIATHQVRELSMPLFLALYAVPQPVVCSVRGYAVGAGMQLALLSDLVVAAESAQFLLPQVRLGHSVDHGESWALPRRVGVGRAMQLMVLGETVSGRDAEHWGIANWTVAEELLDARTDEIVGRLASGATLAIREMKQLLRHTSRRTFAAQFAAEVEALGVSAATDDFVEAIGAYRQKRKPSFTGR